MVPPGSRIVPSLRSLATVRTVPASPSMRPPSATWSSVSPPSLRLTAFRSQPSAGTPADTTERTSPPFTRPLQRGAAAGGEPDLAVFRRHTTRDGACRDGVGSSGLYPVLPL